MQDMKLEAQKYDALGVNEYRLKKRQSSLSSQMLETIRIQCVLQFHARHFQPPPPAIRQR